MTSSELWVPPRYQVPNPARAVEPGEERISWAATCPECGQDARWGSIQTFKMTTHTIDCSACGQVSWESAHRTTEAPTSR